jgi:hypothetical protein
MEKPTTTFIFTLEINLSLLKIWVNSISMILSNMYVLKFHQAQVSVQVMLLDLEYILRFMDIPIKIMNSMWCLYPTNYHLPNFLSQLNSGIYLAIITSYLRRKIKTSVSISV